MCIGHKYVFLAWVLLILLFPLVSVAEETKDEQNTDRKQQIEEKNNTEKKTFYLNEILVIGEALVTPTKQTNETVYTGREITKKGLEVQGAKTTVSVYEAINALPGVNVESPDPYGLAAEQKNIRIRGVRGYSGAMTVEGVPNWGGNPMGPRDYIYDTDNFQSIAVYKGAVPADLGTGVGARGGAIELRPRWPEQEFGFDFSQGIGANKYSRTFLRLDSGTLPRIGTGLSLSYSYTDAQKWKGPGDLGPRNNVGLMLRQPVWAGDEIKIWFNYNDLKQALYRPLIYSEVKSLGANYNKDYNANLTGIKIYDINYYKYNSGDYTNKDFLSVIPITLSDIFQVNFKPYYSKEETDILGGSASQGGIIQKRIRDIERYGLISQVDSKFSWATASLGYWFESSDIVIRTENYDPVTFAFKGHGMYMENDGNGIVHSPFLKLAGRIASFDWQGGLKYFYYKDPASQGYTSTAPNFVLTPAADLYRESKKYDEFLPTLGVCYHVSETIEVNATYGRNQIRPYAYMPLINLYNQNRAKFQAEGVTLNDLFNGYDMEISDNFELGVRFLKDRIEIMPVIFYSKHKNLLTTAYDPRVNLSYYQNIGKATGYGFELETNIYFNKNLTFFLNPGHTVLTYDKNLTYQGSTLDTKDKQVVDTPEWYLKTGFIFTYKDFEIVPMARYSGKRYGDAEHKECIDDYVLADLKIGYSKKNLPFTDILKVSLEFMNIFDKEYVSVINSMDDTRAGSTSYYVGSPFTTMMTVSMEF
ncbi:MAG: TonB-dependent receptor [Proteobacteria bacterium]|nr:TonB-dependent receptor [Pseudomonadota bacterium]